MADAGLARRYATALYEIAIRRDSLANVAEDVNLIDETLRQNPRLSTLMNSPETTADRKKAIFSELFQTRIQKLTLQFCHLLVDKRRVEVLENLREEFQRLVDIAAGIVRARVQTATPMTQEQEAKMADQLSRLTRKKVILSASLEPSLRGGAVVWIGDRLIDGSVQGYLTSIERQIA